MRPYLFFTLILVGLTRTVSGQYAFSQFQNQQMHSLASSQLPSLLGNDLKHGEVFLLAPYLGFGNNMFSALDVKQLASNENITNQYIDDMLAKMPKQGNIWVGADLPIMNIFFSIKNKKKEPFLSFGLGIKEKIDANFSINQDFFSLMYKGNKQFAGKSINLSPSINFLMYHEYFLAASANFQILKNLPSKLGNMTIRPAVRLRYLNGIASVYMQKDQINMYTDPDGRYIDFTSDFAINMSSAIDTPDFESVGSEASEFSLKGAGKGVGIDLGIGVELLDNLWVHLGITDIGSIRFNNNAINYTKASTYRYDGVEIRGDAEEPVNMGDFETLLNPDKSYNSYSQPLPTRLTLSGFYGFGQKERKNAIYYMHNLSFTYVQGFRNYLSSTKAPAINLAYSYSLYNFLNAGINATVGGTNKLQVGAQLGLRIAVFKLGIASNNLLPIIADKSGRGADVFAYLGFYF